MTDNNSPHILLISIGPVQDFIAQARRTRDLWFGSHVLSELSKACARSIASDQERLPWLVFPAPESLSDLQPSNEPMIDGKPVLNVANKILATVPAGHSCKDLAIKARQALYTRWQEFEGAARNAALEHKVLADPSNPPLPWIEQIDTLIEFYAVWLPYGPSAEASYAQASQSAEKHLASRKNLREFSSWINQDNARPKSSLDGARESVLKKRNTKKRSRYERRYRIDANEQLDAISIVKRTGGKPGQFIPISRIATAAWIDSIETCDPQALNDLFQLINGWHKDYKDGITPIRRSKSDRELKWISIFDFDGQFLFEGQWDAFLEELLPDDLDKKTRNSQKRALRKMLREHVRTLTRNNKEPNPYVACLVADGDKMGRALSSLSTAKQQRIFSQGLALFAGRARVILEPTERHKTHGALVYAGGDDVLGFVCLPDALQCAKDLKEEFDRCVQEIMCKLGLQEFKDPEGTFIPTLSVGLGVAHCQTPMADLLELGRRAEKLAKSNDLTDGTDRNALGIIVDKRSGGTTTWRRQWTALQGTSNVGYMCPVDLLTKDIDLLNNGSISTRKIYQVRDHLQRDQFPSEAAINMPDRLDETTSDRWQKLLKAQALTTLARSQDVSSGIAEPRETSHANILWPNPDIPGHAPNNQTAITNWVGRMLIARAFHKAQVNPPKTSPDEAPST